ncbi:30S ribosomal protein S5 [Lyticum sinuosum]|uniref:Small ribosomal subunit protein uS5 n=1 Tax=Lyticum sinuosum TaxID=1332059 RepID=A0AAE5AHW5_9RICK|nr:30S ribosomal protein S5 [Lyticum sinuosum]MDZ5761643.1 30S ribosomal protein S5 [Lyticum sinuosum]
MKGKSKSSSGKSDNLKSFIIQIKRCAAVKDGGPQFSFRVLAVVGDCRGSCGFGSGKSPDIANAKQKALRKASMNLKRIQLKGRGRNLSLYHKISSSHGATKVIMKPSRGTGLRAGGAAKSLLQALGVENAIVKIIGSSNCYNVSRAVMNGLESSQSPKIIALKRGKSISHIMGSRNNTQSQDKIEEVSFTGQ